MIGVIKRIVIDNWDGFCLLNKGKIRSVIYKEVNKMLECGSLDITMCKL